MELFGVGPLEALFVLIIALIVVGPRDIGKVARSAGRMLNRLYRSEAWRSITEASRNLRTLPNRLAREAALEELDQMRKDLRDEVARDVRIDLGLKGPDQPGSTPAGETHQEPQPLDQAPPSQASGEQSPSPQPQGKAHPSAEPAED